MYWTILNIFSTIHKQTELTLTWTVLETPYLNSLGTKIGRILLNAWRQYHIVFTTLVYPCRLIECTLWEWSTKMAASTHLISGLCGEWCRTGDTETVLWCRTPLRQPFNPNSWRVGLCQINYKQGDHPGAYNCLNGLIWCILIDTI